MQALRYPLTIGATRRLATRFASDLVPVLEAGRGFSA
jgi:hypothetical protein